MRSFKVLVVAVIFLMVQLLGVTSFFETGYAQQGFSIGYSSCSEGAGKTVGKGFETFNDAKKFLGSPGEGNQWHHIVEQSQIKKSGFSNTQIQNTNNLIAVDKATHAKISGYYNTKSFDFTGGKSVRDWLAGQSYQTQYDFGINVLKRFGVMK